MHAARARIKAVLDQFLYDRCRTLDHFAGGDLVDQVIGELLDRHRMSRTRGRPAIFSKRRAKVLLDQDQLPEKIGIDSVWPTLIVSLFSRFAARIAAVLTL